MFLYYKNKTRADIFQKKDIREHFVEIIKMKNPTKIQLKRIQLISQTPSHAEITKVLSARQPESRAIGCW